MADTADDLVERLRVLADSAYLVGQATPNEIVTMFQDAARAITAAGERERRLVAALRELLIAEKLDDDDPRLIRAREVASDCLAAPPEGATE